MKICLLVTLLLCFTFSKMVITPQPQPQPQPQQSFSVSKCDSTLKQNLNFYYTTNGTADPTTTALICHDADHLYIQWFSKDQQIISTYKNCNDPLFNEDAVQIFLGTQSTYLHQYFQFQVSPAGVLFFADITNPYSTCSNLGTKYYQCDQTVYVAQITATGWKAYLKVSLELLGKGKKYSSYWGNLFRIDKYKNKPTRYLAYSPSNTSPACFHQPLKFVEFKLE